MAQHKFKSSMKQISEINLTPLMDLTFILLITFIITFPLIEQGIPVNLPTGNAIPVEAATAQTVTINDAGEIYLNDARVSTDELFGMLAEVAAADPSVAVMVRADERIVYGRVAEVLKILHKARISRLSLVTRAEDAG